MIGSTAGLILGGLSAGGSILSGMMGQSGANSAAAGINMAGQQAQNATRNAQEVARSDISPWMSTGTNAIGQIGALLGYGSLWNRGGEGATYNYETDPEAFGRVSGQLQNFLQLYPGYSPTFQTDPGYNFQRGEGEKALARWSSARGMMLSGAQRQRLIDYNQNMAQNAYGQWFNRANTQFGNALDRLYQTAGMGQGAATSLSGINSGLTASGNNALLGAASGAGAATLKGSEDMASGIGSGVNNALMASILGGAFKGGGRSSYDPTGSGWTY